MESGQHDDSNSSSEETHQNDDTAGTGRSYECVFCKRGFTTAQALGGHMNIHRKDRAGRTKSTSAPTKPQEDYAASPRFHQPVFPSHVPHYSAANFEYQMYFPPSTSTAGSRQYGLQNNDFSVRNQQFNNLNLFREDWATSLSLHIIPNHAEDNEKKRRGSSEEEEEEELDLELRLGHDP